MLKITLYTFLAKQNKSLNQNKSNRKNEKKGRKVKIFFAVHLKKTRNICLK